MKNNIKVIDSIMGSYKTSLMIQTIINNPDKIAITIGIVGKWGTTVSNPSTAEATEIGGVIIPSAKRQVAPRIVGITNLPFPKRFTKA